MSRMAHAIARDRLDSVAPGPLKRLVVNDLAILHGPAPIDPTRPRLEEVEAFAVLVAALHQGETILPFRFAGLIGSESELAEALRRRGGEWAEALDRVEGCVEMGLRILLDVPELAPELPDLPPGLGPGAAYLARRRGRFSTEDATREASAAAESAALRAFEGLHRGVVVQPPGPGRETLLSLAFLVPRERVDACRQAARTLEASRIARILASGPWPPYHFAGDPEIIKA